MFDRKLIDDYETGGTLLKRAIEGMSREQLLARPIPGRWSTQEVVIHMMDSDLIGIDRMKRLIAEENPLLIGYNETKFTQALHPHEQDAQTAITIFDLARRMFARVLRLLPDEAFERTGIHNEVGLVKLGVQIKKYHEHLLHHLKAIEEKRQKLGK